MHTLCLLDIKVAERTVENMMKNRNIFEPPRFMSVSQAIEQLLKIKENIKKSGKINEDTLAIGVARIGHDDQKLGEASIKMSVIPCLMFILYLSIHSSTFRNMKLK